VIDETSTLEDVCFAVSAALARHSIDAVLTGGSAATLYAPHVYTSMDADFVLLGSTTRNELLTALADVGFVPSRINGMFEHSKTPFTIDFPRGPLAVGGDYVQEFATLERGEIRLRILTPQDCVRDRLAHFYHWDDYTGLNAAVGVARCHRGQIDLQQLQEWTERERGASLNHIAKFHEFLARLG
jgi:hypothetical protein